MTSLFAFLHHLAAFTLVAALAIEFAMSRGELTIDKALTFLRADQIFGISAGILLVVGLARVFYFEKGSTYYFHSVPFIAKISLFVIVGLLSIYPTVRALSWRASLKSGTVPPTGREQMDRIRSIIHMELAGVVFIILCAVLMARGIGTF
jgi:putative membrane protein